MVSPNTKRNTSKDFSDLYNTPEYAVATLMRHCHDNFKPNSQTFFEPCNGKGNISSSLQGYGIIMKTNELFSDHGESDFNEDFLSPNSDVAAEWDFDIIITNPPYKFATEFVLEGFKYAREQYHFLRINFLEGQSRYDTLLSKGHLKNVYVFTRRVTCTKGVEEEPQANAVCYAWYHFDREFNGLPTLHWV